MDPSVRKALAFGALLTAGQLAPVYAYPSEQFKRDNNDALPYLYTNADGQVIANAYTTVLQTTVIGGVTTTLTQTIPLADYTQPAQQAATSNAGQVVRKAKTPTNKATTKKSSKAASPKTGGVTTPKITSSALPTVRTTSTTTSTIIVKRSVSSSLTSLSPSVTQTASPTVKETSGVVHSSLETSGNPKSQPFATSVATKTSSVSLINTKSTTLPSKSVAPGTLAIDAANIFTPMTSGAPPSQISQRADHPVPRLRIKAQKAKLNTNKFYANFFLGGQNMPTWTHPYSVAWAKGVGSANSWGMSVSHIERAQLTYGPGTPASYFINPIGIQSIIFSAPGLTNTTTLNTDSHTAFSVNVNLLKAPGQSPLITFPLVQGMAFVTAVYNNASPLIQSSVSVLSLVYSGKLPNTNIYKYKLGLGDQTTWLLYVRPNSATYKGNTFTLQNGYNITAAGGFSGIIQTAKLPSSQSSAEATYDASAGVYPTTASISGSTSGTSGSYTIKYTKAGNTARTLLTFALPHHMQTLASGGNTGITLETTTKGIATLLKGDSMTFTEPSMPVDIGLSPWAPDIGSVSSVSSTAQKLIAQAATSELSQSIDAQSNLDSMYYSGKALAKFAEICLAANDLAGDKTLAFTGLQKLQASFSRFINNTQIYPLVYDSAWGGAVSSATYTTGNSGIDFGNSYYNDHHFHYGYFVYAAAVIGYLDPTWLTSTNKDWINMLVRDYANPSSTDPYFPFSRSFDWYHGHSWAKGLFESGDGKDQESSSEDSMAAYALKMWGHVTGDINMEGRGALMMAVQARAVQNYYLLTSDNTVQPPNFIGNKAAGIIFENKIDHTTYFGALSQYIEGIHMIPLMPFSSYVRTNAFVTQEWSTYFANGQLANVTDGWRGILMANYAIINPKDAWTFFSNANFNMTYLDGGASLTWYLALTAALGGSRA